MSYSASPKQTAFISTLLAERQPATTGDQVLLETLRPHVDTLSSRQASEAISFLLSLPKAQPASDARRPSGNVEVIVSKPGVFRHDDEIFLVKPNKAKTRLYAKRLVKSADRLTEGDKTVKFEWDYVPGAIYRLAESDRVSLDDDEIRDITTRYGRCICCGRALKAATSVARMIGPVCAQYFA
jgi:uncharacterized protein DUF6011